MHDCDDHAVDADAAETVVDDHSTGIAALWSALAANERARDERTARLRAMRLISGDDGIG